MFVTRLMSEGLNQFMEKGSKPVLKVCINCGELKCLIGQGRCDYCARASLKQLDQRLSTTLNKIANVFNIPPKRKKSTPGVAYLSFAFTGATVVNSGDGEENLSFSELLSCKLEEFNGIKDEVQHEFKRDNYQPARKPVVRACIDCNQEKKLKGSGRCEFCYYRWLSKFQNDRDAKSLRKAKTNLVDFFKATEMLDSFKSNKMLGNVSMDKSFLSQHTETRTSDAYCEMSKISNRLIDSKLASDEHIEKQNEDKQKDDFEIYYNMDPYEMML